MEDSENALQDGLCGYLGQGTPPDYVDRGMSAWSATPSRGPA
jgi:hypothetical protein